VSVTGGRGHKGLIYEGGLRVPAILEWPARIRQPRRTDLPAQTSDIFPTLLQITGAKPEARRPLDGVSLLPLVEGKMTTRPRPMGFWEYPIRGIRTPSKEWMADLLQAQKEGNEIGDRTRLNLNAATIETQYPEDRYPGHAAWLDWPWKLHRIELYNLAGDPQESADISGKQTDRAASMRADLEQWLKSVVHSLNGKDY